MKNIKMKTIVCSLCLVFSVNVSASFPFQSIGTIELTNFTHTNYLSHTVGSTLRLVSGGEFIHLTSTDPKSNVLNYQLKLKPGEINAITFFSDYSQENQHYPGSCTITFTDITKSKASFKVIDDSTLYRCGLDQNGRIAINFS